MSIPTNALCEQPIKPSCWPRKKATQELSVHYGRNSDPKMIEYETTHHVVCGECAPRIKTDAESHGYTVITRDEIV